MRLTWRAFGIGAVLALCLIPALTFAASVARPHSTQRVNKASAPPNTLRLAIPGTSPTVDPALVLDEENVQLANLLYSGLVRLDPSYKVVLDAAARYTLSRDHRTYTFYLRRGMRFSNGDPLTAYDFAFAINRSLSPALKSSPAPTYLLDIVGARAVVDGKAKSATGVKVVNALTLRIQVRYPVPYFLMELTYPTSFALDKKQLSKLGTVDNASWYSNPISSGPYRLKSWSPNSRMILAPNKYFYGAKPPLRRITISLSPLPSSEPDLYQYVSHSLDVVSLPGYDPSITKQVGIRETKMLAIGGLYINCKNKPFSDRHVRRALIMALDRKTLVMGALGSVVTPFAGYVPPGQDGYDAGLKPLLYDPAAARSELAAAGFKGGKKFPSMTLYFGVDPAWSPAVSQRYRHLAQSIAKSWEHNLKINVGTKELELYALLSKSGANSLPVYLSAWSADYPDPHDWLSGQWKSNVLNNNVRYSNKSFDKLVSAADVTWSRVRRARLYNRAQDTLVSDGAWMPLYIPHRLVYIRPSVKNLALTGYGLIPSRGSWAQVHLNLGVQKAGEAPLPR